MSLTHLLLNKQIQDRQNKRQSLKKYSAMKPWSTLKQEKTTNVEGNRGRIVKKYSLQEFSEYALGFYLGSIDAMFWIKAICTTK